ncbi:hypothetical protein ZWY2020_006675 [Hordeum vulgare]|nr:hypothetical protein ZWY2020_006675 [Hordeum vulgare]
MPPPPPRHRPYPLQRPSGGPRKSGTAGRREGPASLRLSSPDGPDAAATGVGAFDSRAVFKQLVREQTTVKEAGGPSAEGADRKKKPEEAQVAQIRLCILLFLRFLESLDCVLDRFLVSVEQVKSSHAVELVIREI